MTSKYSLTRVTRRLLWAAALLIAATGAAAQQPLSQAEIEAQLQQRSTIEREISQLGQRPQTDVMPQAEFATELSTNMPPMSDSATDAAELLGTEYEPGDDAMFGEQLFQPGIEQIFGGDDLKSELTYDFEAEVGGELAGGGAAQRRQRGEHGRGPGGRT